jgi:hypothetical protein
MTMNDMPDFSDHADEKGRPLLTPAMKGEDMHRNPALHAPVSPTSISRRDDRPIGLVDRRSRLRPPGSQGGSLRGEPNCLAVNALAHRAYTARRGRGDVAMPSALVLRPCPLLPPPSISAGHLQMAVGITADPDILPGRWDHQWPDTVEDFLVADRLAIRAQVGD